MPHSNENKTQNHEPRTGRESDTGTRFPYENTAAGQDDTPVEHTYQTADGREETETIRAADATFLPNEGDGKIATPPGEQEKAA